MSKSVMNNHTMNTYLSPNQSLDTGLSAQDLSVQEPSMSNKFLKSNESSDAKPLETDDHVNAETVSNEAISKDSDMLDDEADDGIDDGIDDDSDDDEADYEAPTAGQAVPVVIDVTYTVTEEEAGLRIDKLASQVFTDFSRAQLQGWISDGSLLYNDSVQKPKIRVKAGDVIHLLTTLQQHSEDQPGRYRHRCGL